MSGRPRPCLSPPSPRASPPRTKHQSVDLKWHNLSNPTITGWEYQYKTTGAYGSWTDVPNSTATTTSYTVTGLTNNTSHTFRIRAVNSAGDGAASDEKSATPVPVPSAPTGLSASPNNGQVALSWTNPNNASIQKVAVPVQDDRRVRQVDRRAQQRRGHHVLRREQPEQQRHPHLQDTRGEWQRRRSSVRRGVGYARGPALRKRPP